MAKTQKCAHQACSCVVPPEGEFGVYCSAHCKDSKALAELRCECGHADCATDMAGRASRTGGK
jgi:hypothetical protein